MGFESRTSVFIPSVAITLNFERLTEFPSNELAPHLHKGFFEIIGYC